jgi:hypothetical protein
MLPEMTSHKEDQQPMTTREELKPFVWRQLNAYEACNGTLWRTADEAAAESERAHKAPRQEVSVEELALELMNARRRMTGLEELSAERVKKIGLWPLKEETRRAARSLLAEYSITKRTTEG